MCGLCGIYQGDGTAVDIAVLERMTGTLNHRGPDDSGVCTSGPLGLGHTRLSIIDLSAHGHQPMRSNDGRYVIVYNGEIYNYRVLRQILSVNGHHFQGNSDTEVALHAYMEWGAGAFPKFEGMFAMALWDDQAQRLHLARDRFGIKPLYYSCTASGLVFGSEIKALLASDAVSTRVDWAGLREYLHYGTALGTHTMFNGISKLPPGHVLTADQNGLQVEPYASIFDVDAVQDDLPTAIDKVRHMLERAVQDHLVSDVPVGVFLSGGIDSSAIVAFASKHYDGHLKTFSAGFDFNRGINELPEARKVAEHFGTDHHELHISGGHVASVIERLVRCHDSPFGDPASIPLYLLSEQLGGEHKVILQGDGGDEIFAGYGRYARIAYQRWYRQLARSTRWCWPLFPRSTTLYRRLRSLEALDHPDPSMYMALQMSQESLDYPPEGLFSPEVRTLLAASSPYDHYKNAYHQFEHLDSVQRMLYTDCKIILPDNYFEKVDKSTMAHSIEVRVPLVDTRLVAYVMGLPSSYKVKGRHKKYILRQALRGIVPDTILDRPKTGFGAPIQHWLRTSLAGYMQSVLLNDSKRSAGLFDRVVLERCIHEHLTGRRDNGNLLYKLLHLALWWDAYSMTG